MTSDGLAGAPLSLRSRYGQERVYVATMMPILGGLLASASETDDLVASEVREIPEGLVFGMSVFGGGPAMRLKKVGARLTIVPSTTPADLDIVFKHTHHAFLVLSFQEGTARAFANDRMITNGDLSLAMKLVRCINRVEAVALPRLVGERALKTYPDLVTWDKLKIGTRIYGRALTLALGRK